MELLEYQAKELFHDVGIPTLPAQCITHFQDLKMLRVPYPIVLKSQVHSGQRGKFGGVRFAANTIDAVAAAQAIFNLPIRGEYPQVLLAEACYEVQQELYLAITLDGAVRRPVLLGSCLGGTAAEEMGQTLVQRVVVEQEFAPFYARRLAVKMGIDRRLICLISDITEKMYLLFIENDLDAIEINPLGVSTSGEVMALDGKVTVNDGALARHADLLTLAGTDPGLNGNGHKPSELHFTPSGSIGPLQPQSDLGGNLAILCNGSGLLMSTLDLVFAAGGQPGLLYNLSGECQHDWQPQPFSQQIAKTLDRLIGEPSVRVVLVNLLSGLAIARPLAQTLARSLRKAPRRTEPIAWVLRLVGTTHQQIAQRLTPLPANVHLISDLATAIELSITLSKAAAQAEPNLNGEQPGQ